MYGMPDYLFRKADLGETLENARNTAIKAVEAMDPNQLLQVSETDLVDHLLAEYRVEPIQLLKDQMYVTNPREVEINRTDAYGHGERLRVVLPGLPNTVKGMEFSVIVPFTGNEIVFLCQPQASDSLPPTARIDGQELHLDFKLADANKEVVERERDRTLASVEKYLAYGEPQVTQHNKQLKTSVEVAIKQRKERILKNQGLVASLGLPIMRRDVPDTYAIPMKPRKVRVEPPTVPAGAFEPEPALVASEYEHILEIMASMALVMERSPKTFAKLDEEEIRDHFLMHLNGHYEGQATGETFNYEGKTDILIREKNRTVFIAECLIWRGEAYLTAKIDQILGYTSWRDTKTAILIFCRNKDFSAVVAKIPEAVAAHPNCKKDLGPKGETQFRYLFHHREDRNRELTVAVMAFNVPNLEAE